MQESGGLKSVFSLLGELPKAIETHLPACQLHICQLSPSKWSSPLTKSSWAWALGLLTYHPGDHSPPRPDPPWSRPPPAPTAMTNVSKSMSRDQQLAATLAAIEDTGPTDIQVYTDGQPTKVPLMGEQGWWL